MMINQFKIFFKRNKLLLLFGCFTTILFFFFMHGELKNIDLKKPINHEKFDAFFSCVGAIGAVLSLYFIYRQVQLAVDAHRATLPDLRIKSNFKFLVQPLWGRDERENEILKDMQLSFPTTAHKNDGKMIIINYGKSVAYDITISPFENINHVQNEPPASLVVMATQITNSIAPIEAGKHDEIEVENFIRSMVKSDTQYNPDDKSFQLRYKYPLFVRYNDINNYQIMKRFLLSDHYIKDNNNQLALFIFCKEVEKKTISPK